MKPSTTYISLGAAISTAALAVGVAVGYNECQPALASQNVLPQVQQILAPLKSEAEQYCAEGNTDSNSFYQGRKNSWVVNRKNEILSMIGCDPRIVEWRCEGGSMMIPFALKETVNDHLGCTQPNLDEVVTSFRFKAGRDTVYADLLHGTGDRAYDLFSKPDKSKLKY